jgi:hypothetical protein
MNKLFEYLISLVEWMVTYRKWYEENINDIQTKDTIKKPPPPPPSHG